jgi:hypothetical protein
MFVVYFGGNVTACLFEMHCGTDVKKLTNAGWLWWGCLTVIGVTWCARLFIGL